ncbi:MAG: M67 family metallopeptidase [Spirochaetaceae bacterium]|jgi:proteasome lid subunit RPN8/RPN11|nr:M67 family metallopeptidase [Spirochaetaceae bacterium]GMO18945.1 MAG: M67 family metallopeptidase [Termitinemataceae bacterium]
MITIPLILKKQIEFEAESVYPNECCGIIFGSIEDGIAGAEEVRRVHSLQTVVNTFESEERYHRFRIESDTLLCAERSALRRGIAVLGFYHSHPDHNARPSDYDRIHALPFYSYVIVSVIKKHAQDFRSWQLSPDRNSFFEEFVKEEETWQ